MKLRLLIHKEHLQQMVQHVNAQLPEEACGLIAGRQSISLRVYPIENQLHSSNKFRMEPNEQVKVLLELEQQGWELVAIYHSHPDGPEGLSPTDLAEAYYPEAVSIIWSKKDNTWVYRGFLIQDGGIRVVNIRILP